MTSHVLIGGLVARDLNELDGAQHRDPDQLQGDPHIKDQGKGVTRGIITQCIVDDIACGVGRGG